MAGQESSETELDQALETYRRVIGAVCAHLSPPPSAERRRELVDALVEGRPFVPRLGGLS